MANETLTDLTAATVATGGNLYGVQGGNSRKFSLTAAGATVMEAADAAAQRTALALGNVDNTSDANKPVSSATQSALNLKLDLAGGTMTGQLVLNNASATGALNLAPTWNNAGTAFAGIYMRATNTASAAATNLIDVGLTSSLVTINKTGELKLLTGSDYVTVANTGIMSYYSNAVGLKWMINGSDPLYSNGAALQLGAAGAISFQSTNRVDSGSSDTRIKRDGVGILAIQSTTTQQTLRIYGTTTGSKYLQLTHDGTNAILSASSGDVQCSSALVLSVNGAASTPPQRLTGTWFTGGTATTTKPQLLIEPTGATSTAWSTSGTGLGVNAASGFTGNLLDLQVNGTRYARLDSQGNLFLQNSLTFNASPNITQVSVHGSGILISAESTFAAKFIANGMRFGPSGSLRWTDGTAYSGTEDLFLARDAANTLALKNSTNPQTFRVYGNTATSKYFQLEHNGTDAILSASSGNINVTTPIVHTSSSATALTIGQNGATNPALQIDASTASSVTGVKITSSTSANGAYISTISSSTDDRLYLQSKGAGNLYLDAGPTSSNGGLYIRFNTSTRITLQNHASSFAPATSVAAATVRFGYTGASDTSLTASTEAVAVHFNVGQTRQHATGALSLQRDFRVTGSTHSFVAASTLTNAAAFAVDGPCIAGTNATITNSHGIYVPTLVLSGTITNAYGATIVAPSGATNNYAAQFDGKIVMSNLPTSSAGLPAGAIWNNAGVLNIV